MRLVLNTHITGDDWGDFTLHKVLCVNEDRLDYGQPPERPNERPDPHHIVCPTRWCGIWSTVSKPPAQPSRPDLEYVPGHLSNGGRNVRSSVFLTHSVCMRSHHVCVTSGHGKTNSELYFWPCCTGWEQTPSWRRYNNIADAF